MDAIPRRRTFPIALPAGHPVVTFKTPIWRAGEHQWLTESASSTGRRCRKRATVVSPEPVTLADLRGLPTRRERHDGGAPRSLPQDRGQRRHRPAPRRSTPGELAPNAVATSRACTGSSTCRLKRRTSCSQVQEQEADISVWPAVTSRTRAAISAHDPSSKSGCGRRRQPHGSSLHYGSASDMAASTSCRAERAKRRRRRAAVASARWLRTSRHLIVSAPMTATTSCRACEAHRHAARGGGQGPRDAAHPRGDGQPTSMRRATAGPRRGSGGMFEGEIASSPTRPRIPDRDLIGA